MNTNIKLSVIICTHNPKVDYLDRTLNSLKKQTLDKSLWEFLLIDNASDERISKSWDISWHPKSRHIREEEVGLTPARLRGIRESRGELLVFVDDDNVLANDYLAISLDIATKIPSLGCFGSGWLVPEFEDEPASDLLSFTDSLALRSIPEARWSNDPHDPYNPWGAGLCIRKNVANRYHEVVISSNMQRLMGRKGGILTSGEDIEVSWQACAMGLGRGIFPELKITHLIDKRRTQREYLLRIVQGHAYSNVMLDFIHDCANLMCENKPSILSIMRSMICLRPMIFSQESIRYWEEFKMTPTQKEFKKAMRAGANKARAEILATKSGRIE